MKKSVFKMAFGVVLAALVVCGLSVSAYAINGEGSGTALLYSYYDVRSVATGGLGLTDNYFTVTNTGTLWHQAHVRVRTGDTSVELLDFDILLSPKDVFTFDLYEDKGAMVFASCDTKTLIASGFTPNYDRNGDGTNDCFVLDSVTFPAMLSLIETCEDETEAHSLNDAKHGYVEIIEEGLVVPCGTSGVGKLTCSGDPAGLGCDSDDAVLIAGKTLINTTKTQSLVDLCPLDVFGVEDYIDNGNAIPDVLIGRQYYANVTGGIVKRLAMRNAEIMDDYEHALLLHYESYQAELTSNHCAAADGNDTFSPWPTTCFAYVAATKDDPVLNGADDMNYCFYQAKIDAANDVRNKFGAAATFGPTMADIVFDAQRNGTVQRTAAAISYIIEQQNDIMNSYNGGDWYGAGNKDFADTHYFATPGVIFDLTTSFSFTFPFQHFIGEKDSIAIVALYDNEENTTTTPLTKFISPGLPTPTTFAEEASLFNLVNPPFLEGWLRFKVSATNATVGCTGIGATPVPVAGDCQVNDSSDRSDTGGPNRTPGTPYVPSYSAAVYIAGAAHISTAPFQFNSANREW